MAQESNERREKLRAAIAGGRFAQKQIYGKAWLISWGHRQRFKMAMELASQFQGKTIFDYGCGDGTFLAMLMDSSCPPGSAVGGERNRPVVEDCINRLGDLSDLDFIDFEEMVSGNHHGRYDAVFCMEVLEHVLEMDRILGHLHDLLSPAGKLIISVPVESGLPLIVKQTARRVAGLRGIGGYVGHSGYTWKEMRAAVFSGPETRVPRIIHGTGDGRYYDHKGFNWKALREEVGRRFHIERSIGTPFSWLPVGFGSQVWIVARRRDGSA